MDTKVKDLVQSAIGKIQELSDADTIIGNPIKVDGKITIIPVSKVSYGFAAGGSDLPSKSDKELFGGGSGAGVTIQPLAFLVINDGNVQLMQMNMDTSTTGGIVNIVPEMFDKIQGLFTKKKKNEGGKETSEAGEAESINEKNAGKIKEQLGDTSDFDF